MNRSNYLHTFYWGLPQTRGSHHDLTVKLQLLLTWEHTFHHFTKVFHRFEEVSMTWLWSYSSSSSEDIHFTQVVQFHRLEEVGVTWLRSYSYSSSEDIYILLRSSTWGSQHDLTTKLQLLNWGHTFYWGLPQTWGSQHRWVLPAGPGRRCGRAASRADASALPGSGPCWDPAPWSAPLSHACNHTGLVNKNSRACF